jgi:hypothetical protein
MVVFLPYEYYLLNNLVNCAVGCIYVYVYPGVGGLTLLQQGQELVFFLVAIGMVEQRTITFVCQPFPEHLGVAVQADNQVAGREDRQVGGADKRAPTRSDNMSLDFCQFLADVAFNLAKEWFAACLKHLSNGTPVPLFDEPVHVYKWVAQLPRNPLTNR